MNADWGAIFDWDGVIVQSEAAHEESWIRLGKELGLDSPEGHFRIGFGRKNEYIIPNILHWSHDPDEILRISLRKEALYREIVAERGVEALPGVITWLQCLADAGVPCVIGSSTHRANIDQLLGLTGIGHFFQGIISAENVTEGKPHPDVFLKCAALIGRAPSRCVVHEDAFVGIEAAHRGGMKAIGVATTHPLAELGGADHAVTRLDELTTDFVRALLTSSPTRTVG